MHDDILISFFYLDVGEMDRSKDILFVLVIYKCRLEDSVSFKTLVEQNGEIENLFVYDNTPTVQDTSLPVAAYVHDADNGGLSRAYNRGCKFACENGYKWLLLLDQDTVFPKNALDAYRKAMVSSENLNMIVPQHKVSNGKYLSPTRYFLRMSDLQDTVCTGLVSFSQASPINSGILVSAESFCKVGGYEESVWLDFSDICFIEKYKKLYPFCYVLPDVVCFQQFSMLETDKKRVFNRFCIYLECARNFPRHSFADSIILAIATLRPTLSRTIKERTLRYIKAFFEIYFFNKQINKSV